MMRRYRLPLGLALLLVMVFGPAGRVAAQEALKILDIKPVAPAPPKIDGLVDDPCWQAVKPVDGFYQHDPINGAKASEETYVWAAFDQDYLYFAFLMKDSQAGKIWAELTPRNEYENNDTIKLIIDAYNDKRTSMEFEVNPKGVQKNSVETIWKSEAVLRPDGWSAEMAIPFKSLRFSAKKLEVWGINFERYINRLNETDFWTDVKRDLPELLQTGELRGLTGLRPGYNLEFFPYAGVRTSGYDTETGRETEWKAAGGLDAKWGIKPNLYLDVTASPDFSEVESDPFIYQLSPYETYFQEHRPFFSEGSQYFTLGDPEYEYHGGGTSLFYSRRVENPRGAIKLSGKTGGFGFGILGAINKIPGDDVTLTRNSYFGVFRVQKDLFRNSQIGFYYAGMRDPKAPGGVVDNQNVALDFNFNFSDFYYVTGLAARTFNEGRDPVRNGIYQLNFRREPDAGLQLSAGFERVEDNVAIETGYIDKLDIQTFDAMVGHAWRYNKGLFKRFSFDFSGALKQDSFGHAEGQSGELFIWTELFNRVDAHGGLSYGRSKYQVFDADGRLVWTPDYINTYGWNLDIGWEHGGFIKEISVEAGWNKKGVYPETGEEDFSTVLPGAETNVEGQFTLRPRSNLEWSIEGGWVRQTIDATGEEIFNGLAYESALHYQLTRSLFLNARYFGETRDRQYSLDFLVGYYFGAGNVVQLSFKKSERNDVLSRLSGYSITLKVSYLFRL